MRDCGEKIPDLVFLKCEWRWVQAGKQWINRKPERKRRRGGKRKRKREREEKRESQESLPVWPDPWGRREGDTEDGEKVGKRTRQVRVHRESRSHPTRGNMKAWKKEIQKHFRDIASS